MQSAAFKIICNEGKWSIVRNFIGNLSINTFMYLSSPSHIQESSATQATAIKQPWAWGKQAVSNGTSLPTANILPTNSFPGSLTNQLCQKLSHCCNNLKRANTFEAIRLFFFLGVFSFLCCMQLEHYFHNNVAGQLTSMSTSARLLFCSCIPIKMLWRSAHNYCCQQRHTQQWSTGPFSD